MFWNLAFHLFPIARLNIYLLHIPVYVSRYCPVKIWFKTCWKTDVLYKRFFKWVVVVLNLKFGTELKKREDNILIILNCSSLLFRWQSSCDWYQHSFSPGTNVGYSSSRRKWEGIRRNRTMYGIFATSQDFGDTLHTRKSWCTYFSAEIIFCVGSRL